jgi:hypothetical protein
MRIESFIFPSTVECREDIRDGGRGQSRNEKDLFVSLKQPTLFESEEIRLIMVEEVADCKRHGDEACQSEALLSISLA